MNKIIKDYFNEQLILFVVAKSCANIEQVRERISLLSNGKLTVSERIAATLLYKLRSRKLISKTKNNEYRITDRGIKAPKEFEDIYKLYNETLRCIFVNDTYASRCDFENEFSEFLDREEVDKAKEIFFSVVRMAFMTGLRNSGENISSEKIFNIKNYKKSNGK